MLSFIDDRELCVKDIFDLARKKCMSLKTKDQDGDLRIKVMQCNFLNMAAEEYFKIEMETSFTFEQTISTYNKSRLSLYKKMNSSNSLNSSTMEIEQPPKVTEDLTVYPPSCYVACTGGYSTHTLINGGSQRLIFNLFFRNKKRYSSHQTYGFIEPYGCFDIQIDRHNGSAKNSKMVVYFGVAPNDAEDAEDSFPEIECIESIDLPLIAF